MAEKKGGAKKPVKAKNKSARVKKSAEKKPKMKEIILHEEWPKTESLIHSEEQRGVILEPERELAAKPEFEEIAEEVKTTPVSGQAWWVPAVSIFIKLSGWLLVPLIVGTTLGKWLDQKYGTAPWLFLITIGIAFVISMFGLIRNALEEFKKIETVANNNDGTTGIGKNK